MAFGSVPCLYPGETIVCLASGPSLTADDVNACRGRARVIAVKDCIRLAPWADVLYGCGSDAGRWWQENGPELVEFSGLRFTLDPKAASWATVLEHERVDGIDLRPTHLATGKNSGYQAINLAIHLGASRIVLLGYDMQEGAHGKQRWFGAHPWPTRSWHELGREMRDLFATMIEPASALGVEIVNATRETAIGCFTRLSLDEALASAVCA